MQIFYYFLLLSFLNLYYSFSPINKKYCYNFLSQKSRYKLNMGCDYYIDKDLDIYDYNNVIFSSINISKERGYYWFVSTLDEDEDGYDKEYVEYVEYKENILQPHIEPILIFSNKTFNKLSFENKYKKIVENELQIYNKTWNDVNKIIKIENRYER